MKKLFERIKLCATNDRAKDASSMLLYAVEEVGEVATCIAVEEGLKDRVLKEPKESEACDAIISLLGLIAMNKDWDYDKVVEAMNHKLPKWESRVIKGTTNAKSNNKGEESA